jgi:hypothetical protein
MRRIKQIQRVDSSITAHDRAYQYGTHLVENKFDIVIRTVPVQTVMDHIRKNVRENIRIICAN